MARARKTAGKSLKALKQKTTLSKGEAAAVRGGRKSGEGQKDFLKVTMKEVLLSG